MADEKATVLERYLALTWEKSAIKPSPHPVFTIFETFDRQNFTVRPEKTPSDCTEMFKGLAPFSDETLDSQAPADVCMIVKNIPQF